jgi:DnaJ-class molecular chaperone
MDPLEILELSPGCTQEDAQRSFRRLSFKYHPDKHPGKEDQFNSIVNAYEEIKKDPTLLNKEVIPSGDFLYTEVSTTIEDLYFNRTKTIAVKRKTPCNKCGGIGSTDPTQGLCSLCRGEGQINSSVLSVLLNNRVSICPACEGLGIKKEFICPECSGKKLKEEIKILTFELDIKDHKNKYVILKEEGDITQEGNTGDFFISLKIEKDSVYRIEEDCLCFDYFVTPAQRYIEDTCSVTIYGKKFIFSLSENTIILEDRRKSLKYHQKIIVRVNLLKPVLSKEIKELYKKIVELEKII